ncbi:hypothetical protein ACRASX_14930 [Flavobacterium sp. TMP13]|uniref:hypothetical protein n=1 Tax=Flavobacterium sp. TMP13 TaxID=3425950 RepID=UPI003D771B82
MEKISISKVVEFRKLKDGPKSTFVNNLKKVKPKVNLLDESPSSGGNYWTTSLSTISRACKENNHFLIQDKINDLIGRHGTAKAKISKEMYLRNIELLHNVENLEFGSFFPESDVIYHKKPWDKSVFNTSGISIQVIPHHVFSYKENNTFKIGAIWFIAKRGGYSKEEIGLFSEALYQYLNLNYSKEFQISTELCSTFDVSSLEHIHYKMLEDKLIPKILESTLESLKSMW